MLGATVQSIIAIVVGTLIISFISRFINAGMRLPEDVKEKLPLLEGTPAGLRATRHAGCPHDRAHLRHHRHRPGLGAGRLHGWVATEGGQRATGALISAAFIILAGFLGLSGDVVLGGIPHEPQFRLGSHGAREKRC